MSDMGLLPQRFQDKIKSSDDCWVWMGSRVYGYGLLRVDGRTRRAHRWIYLQLVGPIPPGLVLNHICHNRACVNPDHLEPVTNRQNTIDDPLSLSPARTNALKTHCMNGHEFTPENTKTRSDRPGARQCKTCATEWMRRRRAERRVA